MYLKRFDAAFPADFHFEWKIVDVGLDRAAFANGKDGSVWMKMDRGVGWGLPVLVFAGAR